MKNVIVKADVRSSELVEFSLTNLAELLDVRLDEALIIKRAAEKSGATSSVAETGPAKKKRGFVQNYNLPGISFEKGFPVPPHLEAVFSSAEEFTQKAKTEFVE